MTPAAQASLSRAFLPGMTGERGRRRRERELAAYVEEVRAQARALLGDPRAAGAPADVAPTDVWQSVATLAEECVQRLSSTGDPTSPSSLQLCEVVFDLYELGLELCQLEVGRRERRLDDCAAGLRRLRTLPSSAALLGQVCQELVGKCGFGRAGVSRVDSGFWRPWMGFQSNGNEFESWFAYWVDQPIPIGEATPEIASMAERAPVVVHDTASTTVHRPIAIDGGRTISYVVAPITRGNEVVAFLHADHYPSVRRVDAFDGEVLGVFADGFSHLVEGVALVERLRHQRDQVGRILSDAVRTMDALCDASIDLSARGTRGAVPAPTTAASAPAPITDLTARERDVFDLMVIGATNGAIAEKLVIAEDTVKSHVKHILRKLGVANRAQAIATTLTGDERGPLA